MFDEDTIALATDIGIIILQFIEDVSADDASMCDAFIGVYDVTKERTARELIKQYHEYRRYNPKVPFIVCANKTDIQPCKIARITAVSTVTGNGIKDLVKELIRRSTGKRDIKLRHP
jgi:hypothetical protein